MNLFKSLFLAGVLIGLSGDVQAADPVQSSTMTASAIGAEAIEQFLTPLKRGTPVELTLIKGKVVRGLYSSYDDYYETVWVVPQGDRGVFNEKGIKLTGIYKAALWDKKTPTPAASVPSASE